MCSTPSKGTLLKGRDLIVNIDICYILQEVTNAKYWEIFRRNFAESALYSLEITTAGGMGYFEER